MREQQSIRYLQVTHIPFARTSSGSVLTDALWARDVESLREQFRSLRIIAPEVPSGSNLATWAPKATEISPDTGIRFTGFSPIHSRRDLWRWVSIRQMLRAAVTEADLVHTSNFFPPYTNLAYAHEVAVRARKKTLFVVAEDFDDMLRWEWVREAESNWIRWRRGRLMAHLDARTRASAATASLTLLHTPAAVHRYRLSARRAIAIRQPGHEADDVIPAAALEQRCRTLLGGAPLTVVAACRHKPLKGIDLLIRALAILQSRGVSLRLLVYGQGPCTAAWRELSHHLNLGSSVAFPGALEPGPAVYQAIRQGHLFAMPHRTTDFGRGFFDGLSAGTPVLAFRTPAAAETVRDQIDGVLAPLDDIEGLAGALEHLHTHRDHLVNLSWSARERALHNTRSQWSRWRADWIQELFLNSGEG